MVRLSPIEFLGRLAALLPPPRLHRHRYHGVLAPGARLRPLVTASAGGHLAARSAFPSKAAPLTPSGVAKRTAVEVWLAPMLNATGTSSTTPDRTLSHAGQPKEGTS